MRDCSTYNGTSWVFLGFFLHGLKVGQARLPILFDLLTCQESPLLIFSFDNGPHVKYT